MDNHRVLHARRGFTMVPGEQRWLMGGYVDWDEVRSRINVLKKKFQKNKWDNVNIAQLKLNVYPKNIKNTKTCQAKKLQLQWKVTFQNESYIMYFVIANFFAEKEQNVKNKNNRVKDNIISVGLLIFSSPLIVITLTNKRRFELSKNWSSKKTELTRVGCAAWSSITRAAFLRRPFKMFFF